MTDSRYGMERIDAMDGHEFEHFIAALLRKLGYEKVEVTPGSGDQGVDVLAEKDGVRYAIQCKCYSSDLGNTPVQEVNTGKMVYRCHVGIVVTNRYFTQGAKNAASATRVLLWDRDKLRDLMTTAGLMSETFSDTKPMLKKGNIALDDSEWKKRTKAKEQGRHEEYKKVIIAYLSADPGRFVTVDDVVEQVLRPAYPNAPLSNLIVARLLNEMIDKYDRESGELISEGVLICEEGIIKHKTVYMMKW